jgi:hypothetical protein
MEEKDWSEKVVYFITHSQGFIYLVLSFILILILIGQVGFSDSKEIIMYILGSNAGIIQPDRK